MSVAQKSAFARGGAERGSRNLNRSLLAAGTAAVGVLALPAIVHGIGPIPGMVNPASYEFNGWHSLNYGLSYTSFPDTLTMVGFAEGALVGYGAYNVVSSLAGKNKSKALWGLSALGLGATVLLGMHNPDARMMFSSSSFNPEHVWTIGPINGATVDSIAQAAQNAGIEGGLGVATAVTALKAFNESRYPEAPRK